MNDTAATVTATSAGNRGANGVAASPASSCAASSHSVCGPRACSVTRANAATARAGCPGPSCRSCRRPGSGGSGGGRCSQRALGDRLAKARHGRVAHLASKPLTLIDCCLQLREARQHRRLRPLLQRRR